MGSQVRSNQRSLEQARVDLHAKLDRLSSAHPERALLERMIRDLEAEIADRYRSSTRQMPNRWRQET